MYTRVKRRQVENIDDSTQHVKKMSRHKDLKIKMCNPTRFPMMLETENNRFTGVYSPECYKFIHLIEHWFNLSYEIDNLYPGIGNRIGSSDAYDGCLGKLQSGEADIMTIAMNYPVDIVNLTTGFVAFDEAVSFLGAFARPNASKASDFAHSISEYNWQIYALLVIYLIAFWLIIAVRQFFVLKVAQSIVWLHRFQLAASHRDMSERLKRYHLKPITMIDIVRHFFRTNYIHLSSISPRCLIFIITCFSFYIFAFFNSRLNTEMVIPEKAVVYENYEEIMAAGVKPVFLEGQTYYQDLKYAPKGTPPRILWDWAVAKFGGERSLFTEMQIHGLALFASEGLSGETLLFGGEVISQAMKKTCCELLARPTPVIKSLIDVVRPSRVDWKKFDHSQAYMRRDKSSKSVIKTIVLGQMAFEYPELAEKARVLFTRVFEYGHFQGQMRIVGNSDFLGMQPGLKDILGSPAPHKFETRYICNQYNHPVARTINLVRTHSTGRLLMNIFLVMTAVSFVTLVCEICIHRLTRKKLP